MSRLATTKLSSKGQIVIPEEIREQMGMHVGDQFVVVAENDIVILKTIVKPKISELSGLVKKVRKAAKEAGVTKSDVVKAIKEARKK